MSAAPKPQQRLSKDDADLAHGPRHLDQNELSRRWTISSRTLERWRWRHEGPAYLKIGGRVAYRLEGRRSLRGQTHPGRPRPLRHIAVTARGTASSR